jgi:hypothetical protein
MKKLKTITKLTSALIFLSVGAFSQQKKEVYFLADTINVSPQNRILEIGKESTLGDTAFYCSFYCQCLPPYDKGYKPGFSFLRKPGDRASIVVSIKPDVFYISWKELSQLIAKEKYDFDKKYDFYITEVLPGNKYQTDKVKMTIYKEPIVDRITIKDRHR